MKNSGFFMFLWILPVDKRRRQRRIDFEATSCAYGDRRRPVARNVLAANNKYTLTNITLALLFMHTRVTCVM